MSKTKEELLKPLAELIFVVIQTPVEPDDMLRESGLVDSMTAVDIMLAVEKEYGCKTPPTEIDEHLESLNALAAFVEENQKA